MFGSNKNFRRKLRAPARNDQEVFMAIKTHLALSSPIDLHTFLRGVALVRKKREISLFRFPSFLLVLPFFVFDIRIS